MDVNKVKISLTNKDKYVNIPISMEWDFTGRDNAIESYEKEVVRSEEHTSELQSH